MPIRLIALLVLSSVLAVFGQDQRKPATYYLGLEQEPIRGRTIGITDGDTIKVLSADKEQILVRIALSMRRKKASRSASEPSRP